MPSRFELQVYYRVDEDSSECTDGVSGNEMVADVNAKQESPVADVVAEQVSHVADLVALAEEVSPVADLVAEEVSPEPTSNEGEPGSIEKEDLEEEVEEMTSDDKEQPQLIP